MAEGKTKAPSVDGKRLAKLEAGVSSLALALTANGIELKEGADPVVAAIVTIKRLADQAAERDDRVTALIGATTGVIGRFAPDMKLAPLNADEQLIDVQIRLLEQLAGHETPCDRKIRALEEENKELQQDVEDLASAKNELTLKLAGEGGQPDAEEPVDEPEVEAEPEVPARERPEAARDVGPMFGGITFAELGDAIRAEATFSIAFSNGEFEIVDFPPVKIGANDLHRVDGSRYVVAPAIDIKGGAAAERIHGAGLMMEGVQVAYCALEPAAVVLPGHEWRFHRSLIF